MKASLGSASVFLGMWAKDGIEEEELVSEPVLEY